MPNYEAAARAIAEWAVGQQVDHTHHHYPEGEYGCPPDASYNSREARDVAAILRTHGVLPLVEPDPAADPEEPTEGWQKYMATGQRVAHYIRDTESLCGRLMFYTSELVEGGLDAAATVGDCAACRRKVSAEVAKREAGK